MRKPRVIFRWMRRAWRRWSMPSAETRAISSIEPTEFADLLRSGRAADLKTLAKRLSGAKRPFAGMSVLGGKADFPAGRPDFGV